MFIYIKKSKNTNEKPRVNPDNSSFNAVEKYYLFLPVYGRNLCFYKNSYNFVDLDEKDYQKVFVNLSAAKQCK